MQVTFTQPGRIGRQSSYCLREGGLGGDATYLRPRETRPSAQLGERGDRGGHWCIHSKGKMERLTRESIQTSRLQGMTLHTLAAHLSKAAAGVEKDESRWQDEHIHDGGREGKEDRRQCGIDNAWQTRPLAELQQRNSNQQTAVPCREEMAQLCGGEGPPDSHETERQRETSRMPQRAD